MTAWKISTLSALTAVAVSLGNAAPSDDVPDAKTKNLTAEAAALAKTQLEYFGQGYAAHTDTRRRLVYISALDEKHFRQTMLLLSAVADAHHKTLFLEPPTWNVTVILPTVQDYKPLAPADNVLGFYRPTDRTLISIDRGRVLVHEFTHALHHADSAAVGQHHPIWISEGLATLFEASKITPQGLVPLVDQRLVTIQKAIRKKTVVPLEKLFRLNRIDFIRNAELCYAEARYVMLYIHRRGLLKRWYEQYKADYKSDQTGAAAMKKLLGKRTSVIEDDWKKWVRQLRLPWGEVRAGQGRLGAEVQDHPQGVKIVGFAPGSAAERAGRLKNGDIIEKFNGRAIRNPAEFVAAVRAAGANRTVTIQLLRNGRRMTVSQPLSDKQEKLITSS